jgi:hypothetical protein
MTVPTTSRPKGTALPRVAGLLFLAAGLAAYGLIATIQAPTDPTIAFGNLLPVLVFGYLGLLVLPVAFLLLFIWLPKTPTNGAFLLLALGSFLTVALKTSPPPVPAIVEAFVALLAVFTGVFVVVRREFPLVTGILFLVAMVVSHFGPYVTTLLPPEQLRALEYSPLWANVVAYGLLGLALLIRPRRDKPDDQ